MITKKWLNEQSPVTLQAVQAICKAKHYGVTSTQIPFDPETEVKLFQAGFKCTTKKYGEGDYETEITL